MGVYSMDSITRYIYFYEILKKRNAKYPFAQFNTDGHNKPVMHWWSFMDIHPPLKKNIVIFDSLGLDGFKFLLCTMMKELLANYFSILKNVK